MKTKAGCINRNLDPAHKLKTKKKRLDSVGVCSWPVAWAWYGRPGAGGLVGADCGRPGAGGRGVLNNY